MGMTGLPLAIIVDIDGTLALHNGRGPFDYDKCDTDLPNRPVVDLVRELSEHFKKHLTIILVSGRAASCREKTEAWLENRWIEYDALYMPRGEKDFRKDVVIKQEIYDAHIRDQFDVWFVLDDRDQVVALWRSLGLTCLQVAPGNF